MAELGQLSYSVILNDKNFNKQAQDIVKKLKNVNNEIEGLLTIDSEKISKPFNLAGMSIEKMVTQAKVLETAFKALSQSGTGELSQDAQNLKLRWQEIQEEVSRYGLNLKSSLMEQQKIVEPLRSLQDVLAMPTNSLDEVAAKLGEVRRVRAGLIDTDSQYAANMTRLNQAETELIASQKAALAIGKETITIEQQLTDELLKKPIAIKEIASSAKTLEILYESLDDRESELGIASKQRWQEMQEQLRTYGYIIKSSVMEQRSFADAMAMAENTVPQMDAKIKALKATLGTFNKTEAESIVKTKEINAEIMRLGDEMKKMGARQYNLADLARNTNGAFSPLGFSIQQVARELPSLTMGAQMFFLAISNNIPIVTDEIKKAKESYKALVAEGKAATPVWKQVVSSIFSWQTAMVAGITVLTMFGRDIGNWIKNLFGAKKANDELKKSLNEISKSLYNARLEGNKNAQQELTNLNLVYKASQDDKRTKQERIAAVKELQKQYPSYFKNLNAEQILAGKGVTAYKKLANAILESARARAVVDKITENETKKLDLTEKKIQATYRKIKADEKLALARSKFDQSVIQEGSLDSKYAVNQKSGNAATEINKLIGEVEELNTELDGYVTQIDALTSTNKRLADSVKVTDLIPNYKDSDPITPKTPSIYGKQEEFNRDQIRAAEDLETDIAQAKIDADQDGFEKRMAQMKLNHEVELREIKRHREDLLQEIIDNERKLFEADPKNKGKKFSSAGITMSAADEDRYNRFEKETKARQKKEIEAETQRHIQDIIKKYEDLAAKRESINKEFDSDLVVLEALPPSEENDRAISQLKKQWANALDELGAEALKLSPFYQKLFGDIEDYGTKGIQSLISQTETLIQNLKQSKTENGQMFFGDIDGQQYEVTESDLARIIKQLNELQKQAESKNPFKKLTEWRKKYNEAAKDSDEKETAFIKSFQAAQEIAGGINESLGESRELMDALGIKLSDNMNQALDGVDKMLSSFSSIDITKPFSIVSGSIGMIMGALKTLGGLFGGGANVISEETFKRYDNLISALKELTAAQKGLISTMAGSDVVDASEAARKNAEGTSDAARKMGKDWLNSGASSGFLGIGSKASEGKKLKENLADLANDFNKLNLGVSFEVLGGRVDGLFGLSVDQLTKLKRDLPEFWARLDDKTREYLQTIIDSEDEINEIIKTQNESLTGLSFDSAKDALKDFLLSADTTMQDVANNFEDYMRDAMVNIIVDKTMNESLEEWYSAFANAMRDNILSEGERSDLQKMYNDIYAQGLNLRDSALEAAGLDVSSSSERKGLSGSLARASQESIDELTGVMYAGLEKLSLTANSTNAININVTAMSAELKTQTTLLRSIDGYAANLPYMRTGIESMVNQGVRIKPQ